MGIPYAQPQAMPPTLSLIHLRVKRVHKTGYCEASQSTQRNDWKGKGERLKDGRHIYWLNVLSLSLQSRCIRICCKCIKTARNCAHSGMSAIQLRELVLQYLECGFRHLNITATHRQHTDLRLSFPAMSDQYTEACRAVRNNPYAPLFAALNTQR